jgi:HlyD family secretion protein
MRFADFWKKRKKSILIYGTLLAAVAVILKLTVFAPPKVEAVAVSYRDLREEVFGVGTVEAKVVVNVGTKITGRITRLYVDQGDHVKKGQLLAILENKDFQEQVRQDEGLLMKARANLEANRASIRRGQSALALARKNEERYGNLLQKKLVSQLEYEQRQNERIAAEEDVKNLEAQQEAVKKDIQANAANLDFARVRLEDTSIYAPLDGVVISREAEAGDAVVAGAAIFRVADPRVVWVVSHIDETVAGEVRLGQPAKVSLRSRSREPLPGKVERIEVESNRVTEERTVDVTFNTASRVPTIGEQAEVLIVARVKPHALAVPARALVSTEKGRGVWVIKDGRIKFRPVTTGISDPSGWVEIKDGLQEEEKMAAAPPPVMMKLKENARVSIVARGKEGSKAN